MARNPAIDKTYGAGFEPGGSVGDGPPGGRRPPTRAPGSGSDAQQDAIDQQNAISQQMADDARAFNEAILAQQAQQIARREANIAAATKVINSIFGNRGKVFDRYADTTFNLNRDRLTDRRDDEELQLKFALARAGNMGGSVDVDRHATLDDRFNTGLLEARSFADQEAARLAAAESDARNALLGLASSGTVSGGHVRGVAQNALQASNAALETPVTKPGLGDLLAGLSDTIGQALFSFGGATGGAVPFGGDRDQFNSFNARNNKKQVQGDIVQV